MCEERESSTTLTDVAQRRRIVDAMKRPCLGFFSSPQRGSFKELLRLAIPLLALAGACYIKYNFSQGLNSAFPLGHIGRTIYDALRPEC